MPDHAVLALRLAGPLQSWGTTSQYNRRDAGTEPSKAGIVGLLAAAQGRPREADIADLVGLRLAVRCDQPGSLLRDFHTVSTTSGDPLPAAKVNAKGIQQRTSPKKFTHVTTRLYLQDAVFTALVEGPRDIVAALREAVLHPEFFLALGRRSCTPTQPLVIEGQEGGLHAGPLEQALRALPWQGGRAGRAEHRASPTVTVAATIDDAAGLDVVADVPISFNPLQRGYTTRQVRHLWIDLPTGNEAAGDRHDPFALLGW